MTKRFVAGAVCPNCQALDRIVIESVSDDTTQKRCVECGFAEAQPTNRGSSLPKTRLEQTARGDVDQQDGKASPVRIITPDSNDSGREKR